MDFREKNYKLNKIIVPKFKQEVSTILIFQYPIFFLFKRKLFYKGRVKKKRLVEFSTKGGGSTKKKKTKKKQKTWT